MCNPGGPPRRRLSVRARAGTSPDPELRYAVPMARNDRLFALAALLKGRRVHTADSLAARLGVSVRTLYRDVDALRDMAYCTSPRPPAPSTARSVGRASGWPSSGSAC